jgi:hypothetical protein
VTEDESRFYSLLTKADSLTDEEIVELRSVLQRSTAGMVRPHIIGMAQLRVALDLTESIRRFDRASGIMVETTNALTRWILVLTAVAVILAATSVVASAWPYLIWWIGHNFRFH